MKKKQVTRLGISLVILAIGVFWIFRDRIETILINNSNKSEYISISSYIDTNDGGLLYLDKNGKKTKIFNKDIIRGNKYGYNEEIVYVASSLKRKIFEIDKKGNVKEFKYKFKEDKKDGINVLHVLKDKMYFSQNLRMEKERKYVSRIYCIGQNNEYNVDLPGFVTEIIEIEERLYITAIKMDGPKEMNAVLYILDSKTGKILEGKMYENYGSIKELVKDEEENMYGNIFIYGEFTYSTDENVAYKSHEIHKINRDKTTEHLLIDNKKIYGKIIKIVGNNLFFYDQETSKLRIIDLKEKKDIYIHEKEIKGFITNEYIKDNKIYINFYIPEEDKNVIYIYNIKENKMEKIVDLDIRKDYDYNMIFPIRDLDEK